MNPLAIYVPNPEHPPLAGRPITAKSGIVGTEGPAYFMVLGEVPDDLDDRALQIDFEGNLYGASNIKTWADRVYHAADRHLSRYPTIARATVPIRSMIQVGTIEGRAITVTKPEALARWLGVTTVPPKELRLT